LSANIDNVEVLALSQEEKSQTHSEKVRDFFASRDLQYISDFSQQDY